MRPLVVATVSTGSVFALIKTTQDAAAVFASTLGWIQWLGASVASRLVDGSAPAFGSVAVVADSTDLVALVSLGAAALVGWRRVNAARDSGESALP